MSSKLKMPLLLILAVVIILTMLRLAVWQLDRAEQKQQTLDQVRQQAEMPSGRLLTLLKESDINDLKYCLLYTSPSPRDLSTSRMPSSA